jgi:hypothetical protein
MIDKLAQILFDKYNATIDRIAVAKDELQFYIYFANSNDRPCMMEGELRLKGNNKLLGYFCIKKLDVCLNWNITCTLDEDLETIVDCMVAPALSTNKFIIERDEA